MRIRAQCGYFVLEFGCHILSKRHLLINICPYARKKRGLTFESTPIRGIMRNVKCNSAGGSTTGDDRGFVWDGFIYRLQVWGDMAKTDHFYIRSKVNNNTVAAFEQTEIDLGSFVDALGKSVLRIHSISVQFSSQANPGFPLTLLANNENAMSWQLTTQSQAAIVDLDNKSVISIGSTIFSNSSGVAQLTNVFDQGDRVDQRWTDGYLIAVEQIFFALSGAGAIGWSIVGDPEATIILDCTVETLSEKAAMALALSQQ